MSIDSSRSIDKIKEMNEKISNNIENLNIRVSKVLGDQEKDIMKFFMKKLKEIKNEYESEKIISSE